MFRWKSTPDPMYCIYDHGVDQGNVCLERRLDAAALTQKENRAALHYDCAKNSQTNSMSII